MTWDGCLSACLPGSKKKKDEKKEIECDVARMRDGKRMVFDEKDDNDAKSRSIASIYHKH